MSAIKSIVDDIIAYETGEASPLQTLELFATLVRTGQAWQLQGSYGRTAASMIESGLITPDGDLTDLALDWLASLPESEED